MSVLLKVLSRVFWSPKNAEVEPDLDSLYAAIVESEIPPDYNDDDEDRSPVTDIETHEGDVCHYRVGTVTFISSDHGLIDNTLYFDLKNVSFSLQVGVKVLFLAFKRRATEEWRVKRIVSIQDEEWDGKENQNDEVRDARTRTFVGSVTKRDGRNVTLNESLSFSLDKVKADFTPVEGDWLKVEALVEIDENVEDLLGEVLVVDSICPLRWRVFTGIVTHWMNSAGAIDETVFFTRDSCEPGYYPRTSDAVAVQAIESSKGRFAWRALTVVPMFQRNNDTMAPERNKELKELLENKNDITITGKLDFGQLNVGESKEIVAEIRNNGSMKQVLRFGKFHSNRRDSQMSLLNPVQEGYIPVYPKSSVSFHFSCKAKYLGQSSELFVFTFKGFRIGRYLEVDVQDSTLSSVVPSSGIAWKGYSSDVAKKMKKLSNKGIVVSGVRPVKPPAFVKVRLGMFPVPERLWKAILGSELLDDAIEKVQSMMPSLKNELASLNYTDRFHALLYLEEINQNILMRHYDIERTKFGFVGDKEFVSLEVPGLAEKRPSLIIGDKVIAIPLNGEPGQAAVKYEGFIHKVRCTDVLLKFNATFHDSYEEEEYSVSFYPTRTPLRLCHASVDLAKKNLGDRVLFPNFIKLQDPQLLLTEDSVPPRTESDADIGQSVQNGHVFCPVLMNSQLKNSVRLKWFNTNLNRKQKDAVCNVLRGEARPLPYVIFGPPGTGKTITLVETILQIMSNLPDSRLLVATPSNSSADLISERLLDTGMLRPGDLVRLVGYHCLEEGTIPARLIPFSTTGDIRLNHHETADYGQLKTSSNASTLGRHRITIGTCISLGQLITMGFPRGHFTHVLVDEAGQATEPEILVPLSFLHVTSGQIVLAGDPLQLGPVVGSQVAKHFGLDQSFLSRILGLFPYQRDPQGFSDDSGGYNPRLVTRLVMNYRSLPEILHLSSSLFYDDQLEPQVCEKNSGEAKLLMKLAPLLPTRESGGPPAIVFHGIRGTNYQDRDCPSWYNPQEMVQVLYYVRKLYDVGLTQDDMGIITPYQKQVQKLRGLLEQLEVPIPKIGSVEEFQGQERLVIILSTVRSSKVQVSSDVRHALGFVASPQRLNVAITRARSLLLVLGNPYLLSLDPYWRNVIDYSVKRGAYIGSDLPSLENTDLSSILNDQLSDCDEVSESDMVSR